MKCKHCRAVFEPDVVYEGGYVQCPACLSFLPDEREGIQNASAEEKGETIPPEPEHAFLARLGWEVDSCDEDWTATKSEGDCFYMVMSDYSWEVDAGSGVICKGASADLWHALVAMQNSYQELVRDASRAARHIRKTVYGL